MPLHVTPVMIDTLEKEVTMKPITFQLPSAGRDNQRAMTEPITIFAPFHCPIARSLAVIGDRWTILILRDLVRFGPRKFQGLQHSLSGISPNTLSLRLKRLEETGVVDRRFYEQHPPRAEYVLTDVGRELRPVLKALFEWGERHTKYRAVTA